MKNLKKQTRWRNALDFMEDRNAPLKFKVEISNHISVSGTCGLPPDEYLMSKEGEDEIGDMLDGMNMTGKERISAYEIAEKIKKSGRVSRLQDILIHAVRYGNADTSSLSKNEMEFFLKCLELKKSGVEWRNLPRMFSCSDGFRIRMNLKIK